MGVEPNLLKTRRVLHLYAKAFSQLESKFFFLSKIGRIGLSDFELLFLHKFTLNLRHKPSDYTWLNQFQHIRSW